MVSRVSTLQAEEIDQLWGDLRRKTTSPQVFWVMSGYVFPIENPSQKDLGRTPCATTISARCWPNSQSVRSKCGPGSPGPRIPFPGDSSRFPTIKHFGVRPNFDLLFDSRPSLCSRELQTLCFQPSIQKSSQYSTMSSCLGYT